MTAENEELLKGLKNKPLEDLAQLAGLATNTVYKVREGRTRPKEETKSKLLKALSLWEAQSAE